MAIFAAILIAIRVNSGSAPGHTVANIRCDQAEQLAIHYHAHVQILFEGNDVKIPANRGIEPDCFYWMHTHDDSGVIHIEGPRSEANRKFRLGDFFKVWGQPLSRSQVATLQVGSSRRLKVFVDGQPYNGDPAAIVLQSHTQVVLEIGPPFVEPPPSFTWPDDLPR